MVVVAAKDAAGEVRKELFSPEILKGNAAVLMKWCAPPPPPARARPPLSSLPPSPFRPVAALGGLPPASEREGCAQGKGGKSLCVDTGLTPPPPPPPPSSARLAAGRLERLSQGWWRGS